MNTRAIYVFLVVLFVAFSAWPCGPSGPTDCFFMSYGNRYLYELPNIYFQSDITSILEEHYKFLSIQEERKRDPYRITVTTDINDLEICVADLPDKDEIITKYKSLRQSLRYLSVATGKEENVFLSTFSANPLNKIPKEFALYYCGAVAFHREDWEEAIKQFESVLSLPPDQRRYRSIWAAYMLGKTLLEMEKPKEAVPFFEQTRALVTEGYKDTLDLVAASWGWQGRAHLLLKEPLPALRAYIEQYNTSQGNILCSTGVNGAIMQIREHKEMLDEIIQDELLRTIFTSWLSLGGYMEHSNTKYWLEINKELNDKKHISGTGLLARIAYKIGDVNGAHYWVEQSTSDSSHARIVKAKLLMREGHIDKGIETLQSLAAMLQSDMDSSNDNILCDNNSKALLPHLAMALVQQEHYVEALKEFLVAAHWRDSTLLAERIMTIPELEEFIKQNQEVLKYVETPPPHLFMSSIKQILATRLARLDRWKEASLLYPKQRIHYWFEHIPHDAPPLTKRALAIAEHLEQTKNPRLSKHQQAVHYFEAAKIIYEDGPNLLGVEKSFDGRQYFFPYYNCYDMDNFTKVAQERFENSKVTPAIYSQYRYKAANLMKQCADLLPNNDPLTAEALYLGGMYLKKYDPKAADPFYKALVRRNPNLLIAKQADELRWFPKEFTDVVLYTPRIKPLLPRKRTLAIWFGTVFLVIGLCILLAIVVRKRKKIGNLPEENPNDREASETDEPLM